MSNETTRNRLNDMMKNIKEELTELMECINSDTLYLGEYDPHDYLTEYAVEVVDERGRNFAVVVTTGGPHIEIEADGQGIAYLSGYWGGEHTVLSGQVFDAVLDYFIER